MHLASRKFLFLDCQTTGLSRDRAEVLELGWSHSFREDDVQTRLVKPADTENISKTVWRMTGLSPQALADAEEASSAWQTIVRASRERGVDCVVIHYSQFEMPFLEALHGKTFPGEPFPWPVVCTYRLARRLYADLPAKTLRALSGYFGFDLPEENRSRGHVIATQKIFDHQLETLQKQEAVVDWEDFQGWLARKSSAPVRRGSAGDAKPAKVRKQFLTPKETRSNLPDAPGIYEMLSRSGKVLYVGKATSLKARVASYFQQRRPERKMLNELMTQVADVRVTVTATPLEAALLENDRIKQLEPRYNSSLRSYDRVPFFLCREGLETAPERTAKHPWGPFTSHGVFDTLHRTLRVHQGTPTDEDLLYLVHPVDEMRAKFRELLRDMGVDADSSLAVRDLLRLGRRLRGATPLPAPLVDMEEDEVAASLLRRLKRPIRALHQSYWRSRLGAARISWLVESGRWRRIEFEDERLVRADWVVGPRASEPLAEANPVFTSPVQATAIERYDRIRVLFTELSILAKRVPMHIAFSRTRQISLDPITSAVLIEIIAGHEKAVRSEVTDGEEVE